jgi:cytidylate kinase
MNENIIAIDGPAGSGKSSVARDVAKTNGFYYMDSGAYYRAITLYLLRVSNSSSFANWIQEGNWAQHIHNIHLDTVFTSAEENRTYLNQEDISLSIRTPEVTEEIKYIAVIPEIRNLVNLNLHKLSKKHKLVMDGRDIGTEVFPDAKYKFFLTASAEERAKRRYLEFMEKGIQVDFEKLKEDIIRRDESDMNRKVAPLKQAEDAIFLDTSNLTKEQVTRFILEKIQST